uniref:MATH domain-containing protein n=1 Tax=Acrobeloides nanus TaxID=290746 RepID=A0A914E5Q6_9BILA
MFGRIIFSVILASCLVAEQGYAANINETYAKEYLNHYGYWPPSNLKSNSLSSTEIEEESYQDALKLEHSTGVFRVWIEIDRVESGTLEWKNVFGELFTNDKVKVASPPIYVHEMPWRMLLYSRGDESGCCESLGLYLQVNKGCDEQWSVNVSATLRLHAQRSWANDVVKTYVHTFNKDSIDWGYKEFTDISNLKYSWKGYTDDDDNFKVSISFNAHTPHGKVCSKIGIITDEILDVSDLINKQENTELVSEPVYVFGMPWRMIVSSKGDDNSCCNSIGFYLQVNQECSKHWGQLGTSKKRPPRKKPMMNPC